jgi:hypothetical protein
MRPQITDALSSEASPHHQASTAKFDRALDMMLSELTAPPLPDPLEPTRSYAVDLCFIGTNGGLPILHGPVAVFQGEPVALLDMPLQKSRLLPLVRRIQLSLFQGATHALGTALQVCDVL